MMNSRDFQLIALKTALTRTYRYGRIIDRNGNEMTVDQLKARLSLNLPQSTLVPADDIDVNIESVQNISNVTVVNEHIDCEHTESNVVPAVEETVSNVETASDTISETTRQSVVGKLFQYIKDGKNGPATT